MAEVDVIIPEKVSKITANSNKIVQAYYLLIYFEKLCFFNVKLIFIVKV